MVSPINNQRQSENIELKSVPYEQYVGTLVGESTSQEFRLAVAHETIREQDIIAVDAELNRPMITNLPKRSVFGRKSSVLNE